MSIKYICEDCATLLEDVHRAANGRKNCTECAGRALTIQEAADRILELKEDLRAMREIYEGAERA
jgi:hypothetical protein